MQSSSFEKIIKVQFDCLTKKVIKCERIKYYRDTSRYWGNEIAFSELMEVEIMDEQLSKVLKALPEKKRNIIILSYFMDMSDLEIGKLMNLVRSTIYRHRTNTLKEIKKLYKEESGHEE